MTTQRWSRTTSTTRSPETRLVWLLPAAYTFGWLSYVTLSNQWDRVLAVWRTSLTMVFGSFVAGSTPQGGGAIAFPVFTKLLEITGPVARSFSLSIQATGMIMASATIILAGRKVDAKAIAIGTTGGLVGFVIGAFVLSDPSTLWWEPRIPGAWVKVGFTVVIAAMARIVQLCFSGGASGHDGLSRWTPSHVAILGGLATAGGIASSLAGSGADVALFLFVTLVAGMHPKVGIPTSIITMALVSLAGLVTYGLIGGQLSVDLNDVGQVVAVGGTVVEAADPARFDLFGIWLGASAVVVWGAPFGAWAASVASDRVLINFVLTIALAEVITTVLFLDALRTDPALAAFGAVGLVSALLAVNWAARRFSPLWRLRGGGGCCQPP